MPAIEISDETLAKVMRAAHTDSPQAAVDQALKEFANAHDQASLIKHLGTFEDMDTPEEFQEYTGEGLSQFTLIDTSAWTHALRRNGDPQVRNRVQHHLANQSAAWCDAVRLELWAGVRGADERKKLQEFEVRLPSLLIDRDVWNSACSLASRARGSWDTSTRN